MRFCTITRKKQISKGDSEAMDSFREIVQQFSTMQWQDYLDIALVALLLYWCLPILRSRTTIRIAGAVAGLLIITWLTSILKLHTLNFLLTSLMTVGLLALVILFQPELRRMLDHLDPILLRRHGEEKRRGSPDPSGDPGV